MDDLIPVRVRSVVAPVPSAPTARFRWTRRVVMEALATVGPRFRGSRRRDRKSLPGHAAATVVVGAPRRYDRPPDSTPSLRVTSPGFSSRVTTTSQSGYTVPFRTYRPPRTDSPFRNAARSIGPTWAFEIRFPSHDALSAFKERCEDTRIAVTVDRIYDPTKPDSGPRFGLTDPQRETLVRAVEGGYYDIPRRMSTKDLAEEFGISDQAITERLRRAIAGFTEHALIVPDVTDEE